MSCRDRRGVLSPTVAKELLTVVKRKSEVTIPTPKQPDPRGLKQPIP